jgi:hypothetical protein
MSRDELFILLRRADQATDPARACMDLAARVRRRAQLRRTRRRRLSVAATVPVLLTLTIWPFVARRHGQQEQTVDLAVVRADLARLRDQSAVAEATATLMMDDERSRTAQSARRAREARLVDPMLELTWQREQAALVLLHQGDRLAKELNLPRPAEVAYRQASETFPDTPSGEIARSRLNTKEN